MYIENIKANHDTKPITTAIKLNVRFTYSDNPTAIGIAVYQLVSLILTITTLHVELMILNCASIGHVLQINNI